MTLTDDHSTRHSLFGTASPAGCKTGDTTGEWPSSSSSNPDLADGLSAMAWRDAAAADDPDTLYLQDLMVRADAQPGWSQLGRTGSVGVLAGMLLGILAACSVVAGIFLLQHG